MARRKKEEVEAIADAIEDVLTQDNPQNPRHVFYRLTSAPYNLVPKTENEGYSIVARKLREMRRNGRIPFEWVVDGTRRMRVPYSYASPAEAVEEAARYYRRDLWQDLDDFVLVWCESDSIAGVIRRETEPLQVPLIPSRGFSSISLIHEVSEALRDSGKPKYIYYVGDWDPSGKIIPEAIERDLRDWASGVQLTLERLLVVPAQIQQWSLPTKPPKTLKNTHAKSFTGGTVEVEAIPAATTRRLVREAIEQHIDEDGYAEFEQRQDDDRERLREWAQTFV